MYGHVTEKIALKAGLEIRVVRWPQSTKTSVGPPDICMWWSGGLLENSIAVSQYFFDQCHYILFNNMYVLQGLFKSLVREAGAGKFCQLFDFAKWGRTTRFTGQMVR